MIRLIFATVFMTIIMLFVYQIKSELLNPVPAAFAVSVLFLGGWHVYRIVHGKYGSPFSREKRVKVTSVEIIEPQEKDLA